MKTAHLMFAAVLAFVACVPSEALAADADPWAAVRRLVGRWQGTSTGQPGSGSVSREYAFVLGDRFIRETNVSRYLPQERNPKGEVHEHWGMLSYDRAAKTLVLRHFHTEGFVNTYRTNAASAESRTVVFVSESFENLSPSWKAKESYEFVGDDEFVETFELAPPGKPFEIYSTNHFKRVHQ